MLTFAKFTTALLVAAQFASAEFVYDNTATMTAVDKLRALSSSIFANRDVEGSSANGTGAPEII
jgi:hypothetical protein